MELHLGWKILVGLFFFFQLGDAGNQTRDEEHILALQVKVENLVEKIINFIKDYYYQIKTEMKCLPDCVATKLMDILKSSIDCVDENEKGFMTGKIQTKAHSKNFLKCFSDAKKKIADTINESNDTLNDCPDEVTEKTYHINVTTSFTKTFHINIKNGVNVTKKEIVLDRNTAHCFDEKSESKSLTPSTKTDETDSEVQKVHKEMEAEEKQKVNDAKGKKKEKKHGEKAKEAQSTKKHGTKHDTETDEAFSEIVDEDIREEMETEENQAVYDAEETDEKREVEKENEEETEEEEEVKEEVTTEELTTSTFFQAELLGETNLNKTETNRYKKYVTPKENLEDVSEGVYGNFDESMENGRKSIRELADEEEKKLRKADLGHDTYLDYVEASDSIYI